MLLVLSKNANANVGIFINRFKLGSYKFKNLRLKRLTTMRTCEKHLLFISGGIYGDMDCPISQLCVVGMFILPGDMALHLFFLSLSSSSCVKRMK